MLTLIQQHLMEVASFSRFSSDGNAVKTYCVTLIILGDIISYLIFNPHVNFIFHPERDRHRERK